MSFLLVIWSRAGGTEEERIHTGDSTEKEERKKEEKKEKEKEKENL